MTDQRYVVVAMDGSEYSNYAFEWYVKNAHKPGDHVILAHCPEFLPIIQSPLSSDITTAAESYMEENKRIKNLLAVFGEKLKAAKIGGTVKSVTGVPGEVIVKLADEEKASFILTGTRGQGTLRRTFLGSVSKYILHHSHVPVIVCRMKDKTRHKPKNHH